MNKNFSKYNDQELSKLIFKGGKEKKYAFEEIYSRYSSRVYLYCKKFSGTANAHDIFQETFLKYLHAVEKGAEIINALSYLLKIARNLNINFKKNSKEIPFEIDKLVIPIYDSSIESDEMLRMLESAIELLPSEYKEAFVLQTFENLSYQEISDFLELPISTVRNRIVRAKAKLRKIISPNLEEYRI